MSSKLLQYPLPPPTRSPLFKNPSDTVPPTDELETLQTELRFLRQKSMERAKRAGEDLKTIEESMRRMKEREKGKAKAVEKVKRERPFTPALDADERDLSPSINGSGKRRAPSIPVSSFAPSSRASLDPRRSIPDDIKKKKKKRKRDEDSDLEQDSGRAVKTLPGPSLSVPLKTSKSLGFVANHVKSSFAPDFTLPPSTPLLPTRPPIPPPPVPGPSNATDVTEDFSKLKPPAQTLVNTFYTSIEPWIRGIKEEDIGFLEFTADEVEPYVVPKLGRHYSEVWEDADMAMYGGPLPGFSSGRLGESSTSAPKWDPSTLMEADLLTEERSHGPLTERLMSALLPMPDSTVWKGVKAAEDAMEGRPGGTGAAAAKREKVNVVDLEERVQDTMRFHGLLHEPPDYSTKVDDPIATALRHAQRQLRTVVAMNKARKERLAAIARDRLGYQEYLDLRSALDKSITSAYSKVQKKDEPKLNKKKKKLSEANGSINGNTSVTSAPKPSPAALGLGPDDDLHLVVPDHLQQLVETRRQWVTSVGGVFDEKERECPGRIWDLPRRSIYEGLEDAIRHDLARSLHPNSSASGQRTNQGNGDEMDVG
ncbi:histone acetyltransferases subunit 3-domain-containing protein [Suillus clintonianus]|uniref:histone acetyltransferases subunit 3-domain-containing protein n=1 Tax=Suillus clintonianus TaxID=1904413 RepID=UPI001B85FF67|nr:histone acetyltransferases subunit 3-domain-containing protein [Suillus clintonianus]KAG2139060.1 histone acetyltransferases subunit 3-domain-containing protein [Suillus clintonianus]